jgi:hypothetical protein
MVVFVFISIGRHSKSLDTERKRCGYCYGKFELIVNKQPVAPKKSSSQSSSSSGPGPAPSTSASARKPNKFALFVKEHFKAVKQSEGVGKSHGEVMAILSARFAALKVLQQQE